MNIKHRIKQLEKSQESKICGCAENTFARSTTVFLQPERCQKCGKTIKPRMLIVQDLSEIAGFTYPVKIYAGFNPELV